MERKGKDKRVKEEKHQHLWNGVVVEEHLTFYTIIHLGCHIVWARREMRHGASFPREYFIPHDLSTSQYDPEQLSGTCV